ncbi:MAG TPA: DUF1592 domain-containing protein [Planctomycetota bacterium]|nr:DUF1592 domain-containing protein [Planctomycetota bacterium]
MSAPRSLKRCRLFGLCALLFACLASAHGADMTRGAFDQFLNKYCISCHGAEKPKGDYSLVPLLNKPLKDNLPDWHSVLERLTEQDMPPRKEKTNQRPSTAEYDAASSWLQHELLVAAGNTGRLMRRLNRSEYNNTMRDLLLVDVRPADMFPQDLGREGFDNIAEAQSTSPLLIEKYMKAAQHVLSVAIAPDAEPRRVDLQFFPLNRNQVEAKSPVKPTPAGVEKLIGKKPEELEGSSVRLMSMDNYSFVGGAGNGTVREGKGLHGYEVVLPNDGRNRRAQMDFKNELPVGRYKVVVQAYAEQTRDWRKKELPRTGACIMGLDVNGQRVAECNVDIATEPRTYEFEIQTMVERSAVTIVPASMPNKQDMPGIPSLVLCSARLTGPLYDKWPPASHRAVFGEDPRATMDQQLDSFISRAFRRPALPEEVAYYKSIAQAEIKNGVKPQAALALALQAVLVSPNFLFIIEESRPNGELNDYEIAARLSYFLWSSMPDQRLFKIAAGKQLKKPDVLRAQVAIMLKDPKAEALVDNFAAQWTNIRRLLEVAPDPTVFKNWDDDLRNSMREETEHFFRHVMRENLSLLNFIDSNFTFLNERLARHYGISGVQGSHLQKVELKPEYRRGGILTQASVLTLNSQPTRSSPIFRGKFVVDKLFNRPPPNPPADVPALQEDLASKTPKNLREQLALHAADANCKSCHQKIDPWGVPMESYDGIGAWRELAADDLTATLENGKTIAGPAGIKAALLERKNEFLRGISEKMLLYALGRNLDIRDKKHLTTIIEQVAKRDYLFQELIQAIVTSPPFLTR